MPSQILLLDDGDLDDVRAILDGLGVEYVERDKTAVASPLCMLIQCALYTGEERRGRRVIVGAPVRFRSGLRKHTGTLVDLAILGCRLRCDRAVAEGSDITVRLPADLAGGRAFDLKGRVMRCQREDAIESQGRVHSIGVRFRSISETQRALLTGILVSLATGPAAWSERDPSDSFDENDAAPGPTPSAGSAGPERRRDPRSLYDGLVAPEGFPEFPFAGQDLSIRGLRVDNHPALALGARMRLTIDPRSQTAPVVVEGEVVRVDDAGTAVAFDWIEEGGATRLSDIVAQLPRIDARGDTTPGAITTAVGSIDRLANAFRGKRRHD